MSSIIVSTKSELKSAKNEGYDEIIVTGELAAKLKKAEEITFISGTALTLLTGALVAAPFTEGLSFLAAAPIAALTGIEIIAIIAASAVGLTLVLAVFKDYEEIEYNNGHLILRKRR